ncbi:MAG: ornithine cyclodeaminase family protein [Clostridiaceae bacterium]|nr:ornithine cyclodeaminase family protein [Clostridiaceae bacterium]
MSIILISGDQVKKALSVNEAIGVVERVYKDHGLNKVVMPAKINLNMGVNGGWPHFYGSANSMPAYVDSLKAMGIKFVSAYAKNPEKGLPYIHAVIILTEPETGCPLAVVDGTYITAVRTGAASAVAIKHLARKDSSVVGIIGAGLQGRMHIMALKEIMNIKEIKITDIREEAADRCAKEMRELLGINVRNVKSNEEAVNGSDIVITVTIADEPLVKKEWLKKGALVVSLGSYQELDEQIPLTCDKLIVDSWAQNSHRGELLKLVRDGRINEKNIYSELGYIVSGNKAGRENDEELICACLIGMGSLDIGAAKFVYDKLNDTKGIEKFDLI